MKATATGKDHRLRPGSGNQEREGADVRSAWILRGPAVAFTAVEAGAVAPRERSTAPGKRESAKLAQVKQIRARLDDPETRTAQVIRPH